MTTVLPAQTAQCSQFLFLFVHGSKISTALERMAQIYLPLFASLYQLGGKGKILTSTTFCSTPPHWPTFSPAKGSE